MDYRLCSFLSLLILLLISGCGGESASESASSADDSPKAPEIAEGFRVSGPDGLSIVCQTAPRNLSSPFYGEQDHQLEIMGGWVNAAAAAQGEGFRSFGIGTLFVNFDDPSTGVFPLVADDGVEGVWIRIDPIPDLGLPEKATSVSGEATFTELELEENGRPVKAVGSFTGQFRVGESEETVSLSGEFAIGLEE